MIIKFLSDLLSSAKSGDSILTLRNLPVLLVYKCNDIANLAITNHSTWPPTVRRFLKCSAPHQSRLLFKAQCSAMLAAGELSVRVRNNSISVRGKVMSILKRDIINRLEEEDKGKIEYFVTLLIHQSKYRVLKKEIEERRKEIQAGEVMTHNDIWNKMNVRD